MHPSASLRLGALHNGFDDMKSHNLFGSASGAGKTDFDGLPRRSVEAAFVPPVSDDEEMSAEEKFDAMMKLDVESIDLDAESKCSDPMHEELFRDLYGIVESDFEELGYPLEGLEL
jgi:hypothetical protein